MTLPTTMCHTQMKQYFRRNFGSNRITKSNKNMEFVLVQPTRHMNSL